MDLAKDLAWQKIFRGLSTNLKIEKSGFFLHFRYFHSPILSHFPIPSERVKLQPKILILRGRSTDKKKISPIFLPSTSSFIRKFRSCWSDKEICVHCSLDRLQSSLSDVKERNFRGRLEIKGKKNRRKKTNFFFICWATS